MLRVCAVQEIIKQEIAELEGKEKELNIIDGLEPRKRERKREDINNEIYKLQDMLEASI